MDGSTDNRVRLMSGNAHCWGMAGVLNGVFEYQNPNAAPNINAYLVGYTMAGVTFIANGINVTPPGLGVWTVTDLSANVPAGAVGVILECISIGGVPCPYGARMNGSGDNRTNNATNQRNQFTAIIGCDAARRVELYTNHVNFRFFLLGYITEGATFYLNAVNMTPVAVGAWELLPALPANSVMGFIEIATAVVGPSGLREYPGGWGLLNQFNLHPWACVACDPAGRIEGRRGNIGDSFWLTGYAHYVPPIVQTDPATGVT